jgi:hypothetical protein
MGLMAVRGQGASQVTHGVRVAEVITAVDGDADGDRDR